MLASPAFPNVAGEAGSPAAAHAAAGFHHHGRCIVSANRWIPLERRWQRLLAGLAVIAALMAGTVGIRSGEASGTTFDLVPSTAAATCLPNAHGKVKITSLGFAERMQVTVSGLPANTGFDLFVIQVPNAPFGLSWYQGDIQTDRRGRKTETFVGRFNIETFIVAPGSASAPAVHGADASSNPATAPVHTFHLGLWFNSPNDATAAGCPGNVTPFNGDHTAGIQVLNTSNFPDNAGPLSQIGS
jgi:hypothetical protein